MQVVQQSSSACNWESDSGAWTIEETLESLDGVIADPEFWQRSRNAMSQRHRRKHLSGVFSNTTLQSLALDERAQAAGIRRLLTLQLS